MEKQELLFIPAPLMGHIGQAVELANLIITKFQHLTITVLVINLPIDPIGSSYTNSLSCCENRIKFVHFPPLDLNSFTGYKSSGELRDMVLKRHEPLVRDIIARRLGNSSSPYRLTALVVGMFCTSMIDVSKEFGVPSFVFFASNAAYLGTMFHFQTLHDEHGQEISGFRNSDTELVIPSYTNPVPSRVLSDQLMEEHVWSTRILQYTRKYREAKGIIINTFSELEPHALLSYDNKTPPVYTVGPMLKPEKPAPNNEIMRWLEGQPKASVVLLCFGSRGWFNVDQVREIATAIERSRCRFVWSLRRPPTEDSQVFPGEYTDYGEVLPEGFLERTAKMGKMTGWVPQKAMLSHVAIGGFVSHCGWNSILESLWYGVPIATWPMYAEQQQNAYQLVKELGLAVEISLEYNQLNKNQSLVPVEDIEKGIKQLMDSNSEVRVKVTEIKDKCRMVVEEGGSSSASLRRLVDDFM